MPKKAPTTANTARATTAPRSAVAAVAVPARPSLFSAAIRAFPYMGIAYIIFLSAIENSDQTAVVVGIIALAAGAILFAPRFTRALDSVEAYTNLHRTVDQWAGEPLNVAACLVSLGLALLAWARWHATGAGVFSLIAIMFLVIALAWLIRASYLRQDG
jgi:hypothetical protein